jgi:hypothetical protein
MLALVLMLIEQPGPGLLPSLQCTFNHGIFIFQYLSFPLTKDSKPFASEIDVILLQI